MATALEMTGKDDVAETIKFVRIMDRFFDCLNVNNFHSGKKKRKEFQQPYTSADDNRLKACLRIYNSIVILFNSGLKMNSCLIGKNGKMVWKNEKDLSRNRRI